MSGRQWKPGGVAMLENHGGTMAVRAAADCGIPGHRGDHWHYLVNVGGATWDSNTARPARPIVVIDPEDREQVERLAVALGSRGVEQGVVRGTAFELVPQVFRANLAEALRSLVADPKPDEPQGLGALVEDAEGLKWARLADGPCAWVLCNAMSQFDAEDFDGTFYEDIPAVRVLSEGWSE